MFMRRSASRLREAATRVLARLGSDLARSYRPSALQTLPNSSAGSPRAIPQLPLKLESSSRTVVFWPTSSPSASSSTHAHAREAVDRLAAGALGPSPSLASEFLSGAAPSTAGGCEPPAMHPREA